MRVSVWQEFASNHSAHFTVVGKFDSPEKAAEAANELRHILLTIGQWWEQFDDLKQRSEFERQLRENNQLTPPEADFQDQYGVGWSEYHSPKGKNYPLDWVMDVEAVEGINAYRNLVFVEPQGNTWAGPKPFDAIMERLGGEVTADWEDNESYLVLTITCTAPNNESADEINKAIIPRISSFGNSMLSFPSLKVFTTGKLEREGNRFMFSNIQLVFAGFQGEIWEKASSIIGLVEQCGCTDIDYTFSEIPFERPT